MSKIITDLPETGRKQETSENAMFGSPKARLDFYRNEIQYETSLLSNRTNAYLSAQSFLVIAYASSMANLNPDWGHIFTLVVPALLAALGIVSSVHAWPGIRAAYDIIEHWHFKQYQLLRSEPSWGAAYDDSPLFSKHESQETAFRQSLLFSMRTPWIFTGVWAALGVFSLWLQLWN
jgi:hypothetical protein